MVSHQQTTITTKQTLINKDGSRILVTVLIDNSGSMCQNNKLEAAKQTYRDLIELLRPDDQISFSVFAQDVRVGHGYKDKSRVDVDRALALCTAEGGSTALFGSTLKTLKNIPFDTPAYCDVSARFMIVITDGEDNASNENMLEELKQKVKVPGIRNFNFYLIGVGITEEYASVLESICNCGHANYIPCENNGEALGKAFKRVRKSINSVIEKTTTIVQHSSSVITNTNQSIDIYQPIGFFQPQIGIPIFAEIANQNDILQQHGNQGNFNQNTKKQKNQTKNKTNTPNQVNNKQKKKQLKQIDNSTQTSNSTQNNNDQVKNKQLQTNQKKKLPKQTDNSTQTSNSTQNNNDQVKNKQLQTNQIKKKQPKQTDNSTQTSNSTQNNNNHNDKIWIGNINSKITKPEFKIFCKKNFEGFVKVFIGPVEGKNNNSYAVVQFSSIALANQTLQNHDGLAFAEQNLKLKPYKKKVKNQKNLQNGS